MAKSKLMSALDNYKGRDIKLEQQRKKEKEARKRKQARKGSKEVEDKEEGGVQLEEVEVVKANGKAKKDKKEKKSNGVKKPTEEEAGWETDESEDEDDDSIAEQTAINLARLDDSDSERSSDDEAGQDDEENEDEDEEAEEDEEDIPLSDLDSVASEDKEDVIPHQRLTINNTSALLAALNRIQLPYSKLAFSEHMSITSDEPVDIPDVEDDLNRELAFYKQSLAAVKDAQAKLKKEGLPFSRPVDYFAEMVKSDEHMGKIKAKLIDDAAGKKAAAEARKQRDLKKFGKQVQVAKLQERAKDKRETLEKINTLKRKRQGADPTTTTEEDLFDVALEKEEKSGGKSERRGRTDRDPNRNTKRAKKDSKYGFGGKKRHAKSGDAMSSSDMSGYSLKKMKEGKKTGASKRVGKNRRAKQQH
jgi:rRNA-processing protein EBP2